MMLPSIKIAYSNAIASDLQMQTEILWIQVEQCAKLLKKLEMCLL